MMDMARAADAGFARRVAAFTLDATLLAVVFAGLNLLLLRSGLASAVLDERDPMLSALWQRPGLAPVAGLLVCLTVLACWHWLRGTPGALLMGIVVVRGRDGEVAGIPRLVVRLALGVALAGVGTLWALRGRPALHDRLSGTRALIEDERLYLLPREPRVRP